LGQTFTVLTAAGGRTGTFATLASQLPSLVTGLAWQINYGVNNVILKVGLAGDFNNDGKVDSADYVVWRKNAGTMNVLMNDPHGGTIGSAQYNTWRANFGQFAPGGTASTQAVPEPSTGTLVLFGTIVLLKCFGRRVGNGSPI